ncbi:TPA: leucine--tRNA ligase [Candidatus Nomurabacteria bacterium]|nr:MAG: Leucyl-tRNA synthetase [Parcubacteria bacterium RAAC4_OD1_1]HCY26684.1 leucine--tRNA ligase [Candidatus Nomurabacteria bacterium]
MKNEYNHLKIEKKWQNEWEKKKIYQAKNGFKGKKFYGLIEFPYPSGSGLHVGHIRSNTAMDVITRKRRMEGYNVLYPIGWDAFGLPTENYAIKTGLNPEKVTKINTGVFRRQLKAGGFGFDWSREIDTTDPKYFKWTQWIFLQMYKKGLAYKKKTEINWCTSCKIGLANEEVVAGVCERCGGKVVKKEKEQWMLAITKYADRLDKDLDKVNYLEKIKIQQRNWIGKSEGSEIEFSVKNLNEKIKVFTTRADTLFGATYVVLAPEHELVEKLKSQITNWNEVENYIKEVKNKTDIDRTAEDKEKTGVELKGIKAINPANDEEISVWIADYVLASYGTGAVMAVPAHDERDYEFAKKYKLPINQVIIDVTHDKKNPPKDGLEEIKRNTVIIFLKNRENNQYALLNWHGSLEGITTGIMGGVEEGETFEEAVFKEIKEEASISDIKIIKKLKWITSAKYCASHKNQNRLAIACGYLAEVNNINNQGLISEEEKNKHTLVWVNEKDVLNNLTPDHQILIWNQLLNESALVNDGILMNSNQFNNMTSEQARKKITEFVGGKIVTKYKLRDWVFSRQRYWGEPIPIIHCEKCGYVPVPEKDLPVLLPKVKSYQPTDNGESPLANILKWVNTTCPKCKGKAKRETDTMPNWAGSSWYFLRYVDPKNNKEFASKKALKYWIGKGVDWYNGGMEHTTLHLLYSRFWHKFLYDLKLVPMSEPYMKRTSHGMILAEEGEKMSKSRGNVINPDEIIKLYGADTLRLYEMFIGPFDQAVSWSTESIIGPRRFLEKVWKIGEKIGSSRSNLGITRGSTSSRQSYSATFQTLLHKTIKKVSEDIENMNFNTAVSSMMILVNEMEKQDVAKKDFEMFLQILSPFSPHIAEELWYLLGNKKSIHTSSWPKWDKSKIKEDKIKIAVQVNGKVRSEVIIDKDSDENLVKNLVLNLVSLKPWIENKQIKKFIYVPGRIVNIVV